MSVDQTEILDVIKDKIHSVKVRLQEQKDQNQELLGQNDELQKLVQQKQSQISELAEKNQKLSLVKSIMTDSEDANDARVRINKIVREIDRCIALLNRT